MNTELLKARLEKRKAEQDSGEITEASRDALKKIFEESAAKRKISTGVAKYTAEAKKRESFIPEEYKALLSASDYAEKSKAVDGGGNLTYKKINGQSDIGAIKDWDIGRELKYMTDDERGLYNYLYATEGKAGAEEYIEKLRDPLSERRIAEDFKEYERRSDEGFFGDLGLSAESVFHQFLSTFEGADNFLRGIAGKDIVDNPYHTTAAQLQREAVSNDMSGVGSFVYQTAMSGADMLVSLAPGLGASKLIGLGKAGTTKLTSILTQTLMSSQAASSAISEAKSRGYKDWQATVLGALAGSIEFAAEKLPLNALFKNDSIGKGVKGFFAYIGKNAGMEAIEEGATELGNMIFDAAVKGFSGEYSESKWGESYLKYRDAGKSHRDAIGLTVVESIGDVSLAALGGALMGAGMGAGGATLTGIARGRQTVEIGKEVSELEHAGNLVVGAAKASGDEKLVKLAESLTEAEEGTPQGYKKLGSLTKAIKELAINRTNGIISKAADDRTPLTPEEQKKLDEFYSTEFGQIYQQFDYQEQDAAKKLFERRENVTDILTSEERVAPSNRYDQETMKAYSEGKAKYNGVPEAYDLYFALARNLGERSDGRSLTEMMQTLDKKDYKGVLSLDNATVTAAYNAGVEYAEGVRARQAEIDKIVQGEKERREKEKASEREAEEASEQSESSEVQNSETGDELPNFHIDKTVDVEHLSPTQRKQIDRVRTLARYIDGSNFVIINGMSEDYNAKFSPDVRTIFIDVNAGNKSGVGVFDYAITEACTHELAHYLKENAPQKYEELKQFIKAEFFTAQSYEAAVKARYDLYKKKRPGFTYELAEEEVIANAVENIFTKQNAIDKLAEKHRSLFSRIWQFVKSFFEKITGKAELELGVHSLKTFESDIVKTASERKQKQLENMFVSALRTANENSKALASAGVVSKSEEKFSIKYPQFSTEDISKNIEKLADMDTIATIDASKLEKTGKSPKEMFKEYFSNLGNSIYSEEFGDIALGNSSVKSEIRHGLTSEKIASMEAIPSVIEKGRVIFYENRKNSDERVKRIVVAAPIKIGNQNYYMGVMLQRDPSTQYLYLHNVAIEKEMTENSRAHLVTTGADENNEHLSMTIILQNAINVKLKKQKNAGNAGDNVKETQNFKFSLSDTLDREVLTETFFGLAETEAEREVVRKYRDEIDTIGAMIDERNRLTRRFKEIEGKKGFAKERNEINAKLKTLEGMITRRDEKLLTLSSAKPFRDVVDKYRREALASRLEVNPTKVTMSQGQMLKTFAKYTHEKVYTKQDARKILSDVSGGQAIRGRKRDLLIEEIWQGLNKCSSQNEQQDFIINMSSKILDSIIEAAQVENPDYERNYELRTYIKDYIGRLSFSDDMKAEIKHKYDEGGSRSFFGRFGNKSSDKKPIPADVFVTDFARENPGYEYLEDMPAADALFEINEIYNAAEKADRYIGGYDYATAEELSFMKGEIVDELLRAFREGGEQSLPARELTNARKAVEKSRAEIDKAKRKAVEKSRAEIDKAKRNFREKYRETESFYKATLNLDRIARSIRDKKLGTFENATEIQGPALTGLLRDLSRFEYRKTFSPNEVREKVRELLNWYSEDNPMLAYESVSETGEYIRAIRGMLEDIALREGKLTAAELYELGDVLTYFVHFAENYNKVFYQGKWVDAVPLAEKYIERMEIARKLKKNDTNRWSVPGVIKNYFENYSDPLSLMRRHDAYQEDGFYTEMFRMLEKSAVGIATSEARVLSEYYDFINQNPDYLLNAQTEYVTIHGYRVPKLQAIALYMTIKQEHAQAGFVYHGFEYTNFAGEQIKVQKEAERATIEFVRVLRSKSIAESEGISEEEAYSRTEDTESLMQADKDYLEPEEIKAIAEGMRENIAKSFSENDKRLIGIVERALTGELRQMKYDTDMERMGFSNIFKGYYFPIKRSGKAESVEAQTYRDELVSVSNISANKERVKGSKQTLLISDVTGILTRHTRAICTYANMQQTVDFYDKIFNVDTSGIKNRAVNLKAASEGVWGRRKNAKGKVIEHSAHDYFKELIEDIQGLKSTKDSFINNIIAPLRSGMVISALGLNGKVLLSQLSSYGAAMHVLDFDTLIKGVGAVASRVNFGADVLSAEGRAALKDFGTEVDKYCPLAKVRADDNHAYLAQGVIEKSDGSVKTSKAAAVFAKGQEKIMAPIGWVDRGVICGLFEACKLQCAKNGEGALNTEENRVSAGKLLERVILDTQQNSLATEKSAAMRSEKEIEKSLTMFSSDAMKTFGRFLDAWGEMIIIRKRIAYENNSEAREKLETRLKAVNKNVAKSTTVLFSNAVYMAAVALLFRWLRGKIDNEEEIWKDILSDFSSNLIGGLPLVRDIYSLAIDGYDMSYYAFDSMNTLFQGVSSIFKVAWKLIDGEAEVSDLMGALRKLAFSFSQVVGIPLRNVWNAIYGIIEKISKEAAEEFAAFFDM